MLAVIARMPPYHQWYPSTAAIIRYSARSMVDYSILSAASDWASAPQCTRTALVPQIAALGPATPQLRIPVAWYLSIFLYAVFRATRGKPHTIEKVGIFIH